MYECGVRGGRGRTQDLYIVNTWHLQYVNASAYANTFIMCGILYGVESASVRKTRINFAHDMYADEPVLVGVPQSPHFYPHTDGCEMVQSERVHHRSRL
jgi:hypothetical protein